MYLVQQNFKIIIPGCFLGVPISSAKKECIDSSHFFKKARDAIFIQKRKLQDICWIILTLLFYVLDSMPQYFQIILSNLVFYLHIATEMTTTMVMRMKISDVLPNFPFTTSEMKPDY